MNLKEYPTGSRVQIGERKFVKTGTGTFWREEHEVWGNRVSRPAVSLEGIETSCGQRHKVIEAEKPPCASE